MRRLAWLTILLAVLCGVAEGKYLGSWKIDDYLTFSANTHAASTGAATDADAVPAYRIYEDETDPPIVTGTMAKLDDDDTTGFYTERVQLTAASGFEKGKSYTIYISAAVGAVTGTTSRSFQIEAEVDSNTASHDGTAFTEAGGDGDHLTKVQLNGISDANLGKLEDILDGTGAVLTLSQFRINSAAAGGAIDIDNSGGPGIAVNGSTLGIDIDGAAGSGIQVSGTTHGLEIAASAGPGVEIDGTTFGIDIDSNSVGIAVDAAFGGLLITSAGASAANFVAGGNGDGLKLTKAGTGQDLDADITGNITGNLSGSVGSVTGNVDGNVTGSVGSLVGHTAQTGDTFALANGAAGFVAIDAVADAIKAVTDKVDTTLVLDGAVYDFTAAALAAAPSGSVLLSTTVATVNSQTSLVLTAGADVADSYNGCTVVIYDVTNSDFPTIRRVKDYAADKTVTLNVAGAFTVAVGDTVKIFAFREGSMGGP